MVEQRLGKKINDHLEFYGDLEGFGSLFVQYSNLAEELGKFEGVQYLGEWSEKTGKPCGRGIYI